MLRQVTPEDARAIREIYNHYILNSVITFEETPVDTGEMRRRIATVIPDMPWLVYEADQKVAGYAYAVPWKGRSAYRHSAEITVYLNPSQFKKGLGTLLYTELIARLRHKGFHALMGGIALPNAASIALHEKLGFQKVAHFKEVGYKFNRWIDVAYWQLLLRP